MTEQRRYPRSEPVAPVMVQDVIAERPLGQLGNVSESGLMLISDEPLEEDRMLQIEFRLPTSQGPRVIRVGAQTLWCSPASVANRYWTGLEIVDIGDEDAAILRSVAAGFGSGPG